MTLSIRCTVCQVPIQDCVCADRDERLQIAFRELMRMASEQLPTETFTKLCEEIVKETLERAKDEHSDSH